MYSSLCQQYSDMRMRFVQNLTSFSVLTYFLKIVFIFMNAVKGTNSSKISWNLSIS